MGLVSLSFLFLFLPAVFLVFALIKSKLSNFWLLAASLYYYSIAAPKCLPILLAVILIAYLVGIANRKLRSAILKGIILALGLILLTAMLVFLRTAHLYEIDWEGLPWLLTSAGEFISAAGASFYILQAIIYMADTYRGEESLTNPIDLALYISFFPKLISGPLMGYRQFLDQRAPEKRMPGISALSTGIWRLALGICKKVLIANQLGNLVTTVFDVKIFTNVSVLHAWLGAIAYSLQLYLDFSSYSDMAIGLAAMFGYTLPENFLYPYAASSLRDFWKRWHATLGAFFRDYVYIPLGGSRNGVFRYILSMLVTWLLTSLWHGFTVNFLIWGMTHCLLILLETLFIPKNGSKPKPLVIFGHFYTVLAAILLWVVFRAGDTATAGRVLSRMVGVDALSFAGPGFFFQLKNNAIVLVLAILFCIPPKTLRFDRLAKNTICQIIATIVLTAAMIAAITYMYMTTYSPFLYSMY